MTSTHKKSIKRQLLQRKLILGSLLVPLIAVAITVFTSPFVQRVRSYPRDHEITSIGWYQPQVGVEGVRTDTGPWEAEFEPKRGNNHDPMPLGVEPAHAYARLSNAQAYIHWKDDQILVEDYAPGFARSSRFNSMSLVKTVLALMVGQAIDRGVITSEKARLSELLPETAPLAAGQVTVENLLQMTSGLDWNESQRWPGSDLYQMHFGSNIQAVLDHVGAASPAGQVYNYANGDAQWIAHLLERKTGKKLEVLLSEWLWVPLGASKASLWLDRPEGTAHGYCCLFATAQDWLRIGVLMLQHGKWKKTQLVSSQWIQKMLTPSRLEPGYGYYTWLMNGDGHYKKHHGDVRTPFLDPTGFYLSGQGKQAVSILPATRQILIRLGERPKSVGFKWDDAQFANSALEAMTAPPQKR